MTPAAPVHFWQTAVFWSNLATWIIATGTAGAAIAAFYAAHMALRIAGRQRKDEAVRRNAIAAALAPGVMLELCWAGLDIQEYKRAIADAKKYRKADPFLSACDGHLLRRTFLLESIVGSIDVFGDAAADIAAATVAISGLRRMMDAAGAQLLKISNKIGSVGSGLHRADITALDTLVDDAEDCASRISLATGALVNRGIPVPPEIGKLFHDPDQGHENSSE